MKNRSERADFSPAICAEPKSPYRSGESDIRHACLAQSARRGGIYEKQKRASYIAIRGNRFYSSGSDDFFRNPALIMAESVLYYQD